MGRVAFTILIAALLASAPAYADTLESVRAALQALGDDSPISARVDRTVTTTQGKDGSKQGTASVSVTLGADGLHIAFPAGELNKASLEQADTDVEKAHPATQGLRSIDPVELALLLGYSKRLLAHLEGATVVKESETTYDGAPAKLLELSLATHLSKSAKEHISDATDTMKLWVGADNLPVAADREAHYKGRFMLMSFEGNESFSRKFAHIGNRLVVVHDESRNGGSGMGQSNSEVRVTTLQPQGAV